MTCGIEGCSARSGKYGDIEIDGERRFLPLCWEHYRRLVLKEVPVSEKDSRPIVAVH